MPSVVSIYHTSIALIADAISHTQQHCFTITTTIIMMTKYVSVYCTSMHKYCICSGKKSMSIDALSKTIIHFAAIEPLQLVRYCNHWAIVSA